MRFGAIIAALCAALVLLVSCASASAAPVLWGAWVDGDAYGPTYDDPPWDMAAQDVFESHTGKRASIIHYGQAWQEGGVAQPFYPGPANAVRARGAVPLIDWNPWDLWAGGSASQPKFRLSRIASGQFDGYIRSWARGVAAWGHRIMVRPMHEMNGNWYPWSERTNGNRSGDYVKAWKRIISIARAERAYNVEWVWCPNVVYSGSIPLPGLFPGQSNVDWVCLDGYNWGTPWTSFADVIGPTYRQLRSLAPDEMVMVGETGSREAGGSKAAWITAALATVPRDFPAIGAFLWFNWDTDNPWRIESSPAAQEAFRVGISNPSYVAGG